MDNEKGKKICLELFAVPKYSLTVNLTLEIPRVNISTQTVQRRNYNITKRPDPSVKQIVILNFHLICNESKELNVAVNELEPIEGFGTQHFIYNDLTKNGTNNWIVKTYFSQFIMIYTVKTSWLNELSEIVIFRDVYHYVEGFERENNYTTERVPLLANTLSVTFSLIVFGFTLVLIPGLRTISLRYYPWLTISIISVSILVFFFWTPAQFHISFGFLSVFLSYFPHFSSSHLIGNLKLGAISLFLLESWVGEESGRSAKMKLEILVFIVGSNFIFWLLEWVDLAHHMLIRF